MSSTADTLDVSALPLAPKNPLPKTPNVTDIVTTKTMLLLSADLPRTVAKVKKKISGNR